MVPLVVTAPSASVVVINWNSDFRLCRTLANFAQQPFDDFVDNASSDDSLARATPLLPQARLLQQARNLRPRRYDTGSLVANPD